MKNNEDKCYLIVDNVDSELTSKYTFPNEGEHNITLVIKEDNINFSKMFYDGGYIVISVFKVEDASSLENLDVSESEDLSYMFCNCYYLHNFEFLKN